MAEWFATTADVFVLTGDLPEDPERHDTPDGQPLTRQAAARRVLRMVGADLEMSTEQDARELALAFAQTVVDRVSAAIDAVARHRSPNRVVISGSGAFIAQAAAARAVPGGPGVAIDRLADSIGAEASRAACAYAMVRLWEQAPPQGGG